MVWRNIRVALRQIARRPFTSAIIVLTLGLGIGVNASLFSVADAVLFRSLPYPEPDELVAVWEGRSGSQADIPIADGNFFDVYRASQDFLKIAAHMCSESMVGIGANRFRVPTCGHTRDFFEVLGVEPLMGTTAVGDQNGGLIGAVIGHRFWHKAFGGAEDVLGRSMVIFGYPMVVTGVMPPGFDFPQDSDIWVNYEPFIGQSRTAHNLQAIGRLQNGTSLEVARSQMEVLAEDLMTMHGAEITGSSQTNEELTLHLRPLHKELVGDASRSFILLFAVVGLVLLIACGNIVSLLTARLVSRRQEFGVRQALGAGRAHIFGQLLTEGMMFGIFGTIAGLVLAYWSLSLAQKIVPPSLLHAGGLAIDDRVIVFGLALGLLAGSAFGLLPLTQIGRRGPISAMQSGTRAGASGVWGRRLGRGFAIAQYAFSWTTLAVATILVGGLVELYQIEPGFRTNGWTATEIIVPTDATSRYSESEARRVFYRQLLDEVSSLPGVHRASLTMTLPFNGQQINGLVIRSSSSSSDEARQANPDFRIVGDDYFEALGVAVLRGRVFEATDAMSSRPVAIINQALAQELWGDEDPLGQYLMAPGLDPSLSSSRLEIVGVVKDTRHRHLASLPRGALYVPWYQTPSRQSILHLVTVSSVESSGDIEAVRQRVQGQDPSLPIGPSRTVAQLLMNSTAEPRFRASFLVSFAVLALVLALLGVYGMMSYMFSRRQAEMAVRMAMGASRWKIRRLYLKDGLLFIVLGQSFGILAFVLGSQFLKSFLYGMKSPHLGFTVAISCGLALAVLMACYLPTLRVGRISLSQLMRVT